MLNRVYRVLLIGQKVNMVPKIFCKNYAPTQSNPKLKLNEQRFRTKIDLTDEHHNISCKKAKDKGSKIRKAILIFVPFLKNCAKLSY